MTVKKSAFFAVAQISINMVGGDENVTPVGRHIESEMVHPLKDVEVLRNGF